MLFYTRRNHHLVLLGCWLSTTTSESSNNSDQFNYRGTVDNDFGPSDWDLVTCDDVGQCLGWPDDWELGVGWGLKDNVCRWCPADGSSNCGDHSQSPIDLLRAPAMTGHDTEWYVYNVLYCIWQWY